MKTGNPLARVVDAAAKGPERLVSAATLLPRVERLLSSAERLFVRLDRLLDKLEDRDQQLGEVIDGLGSTRQSARAVVDDVGLLGRRVGAVLDSYEPRLTQAVQTLSYATDRIGSDQIDAVVAYLEFLPLLQALDRDVVPTMKTLQTVAPDLAELLAVSRALNELMGSLPGLGRAKKRVDEELEREREQ